MSRSVSSGQDLLKLRVESGLLKIDRLDTVELHEYRVRQFLERVGDGPIPCPECGGEIVIVVGLSCPVELADDEVYAGRRPQCSKCGWGGEPVIVRFRYT